METLETLRYHLEVHEASYSMAKKARDATRQRIAEFECPYKVGQDVWAGRKRYQVMYLKWSGWTFRSWRLFGQTYGEDSQLVTGLPHELLANELTAEPPKEA